MKTPPLVVIITILIATFALPSVAQRQRTTIQGTLQHERLTAAQPAMTTIAIDPTDSLCLTTDSTARVLSDMVRLSGYDKPVNASRETLHVTNLTDSVTIHELEILITYIDKQHRELHQRRVTLHHTVQPRHTQLVTFPTWDQQRSFYYILSPKPRRQVTPYDITTDILSITFTRQHARHMTH